MDQRDQRMADLFDVLAADGWLVSQSGPVTRGPAGGVMPRTGASAATMMTCPAPDGYLRGDVLLRLPDHPEALSGQGQQGAAGPGASRC